MPSYSVSLNAVVSPTGGSIARLDAVCAAGPATNMVVVANTANLAVAGGKFRGVALEAAAGNQAIQIVDFGTVDLLGTVLSGTGDYVSVNATGQLVRTTTVTAATIGTLENGTVHVNVALGIAGATTSATAIQGVSVSSASAARSWGLFGDGTNIRSRRDVYNFLDWGPDQTGVVACDAQLRQALNDIPSYSDLYIPTPTNYFRLECDATAAEFAMLIAHDTAGGLKRGIRIIGEGASMAGGGVYHFRVASKIKRGTAASCTARTNGGPFAATFDDPSDTVIYGLDMVTGTRVTFTTTGTLPAPLVAGTSYWLVRQSATTAKLATTAQNARNNVTISLTTAGAGTHTLDPGDYHQTWTLDGSTTGVTVANKTRLQGRYFRPYGVADEENVGGHMIVDVIADNTIRVSNRNSGAPSTDANNGSISWWIEEPVFDFRGSDNTLENLRIGMIDAGDVGAMVEINHPNRPGASVNTRCHVLNCWIGSDAASSGNYMVGISICRDVIGMDPAFFDWRGYNGLGEMTWANSTQVSEGKYSDLTFLSPDTGQTRSAVEFYSTSAQSKNNKFHNITFSRQEVGIRVPYDRRTGGIWGQDGKAHFDLDGCQGTLVWDAVVQIGPTSGSEPVKLREVYFEAARMLAKGMWNGTQQLSIDRCYMIADATWEHPSGCVIRTGAQQLLITECGWELPNANAFHIEHLGIQTNRECSLVMRDCDLRGTTAFTTMHAIRNVSKRGPYDLGAGGQKRGFKVDGGAQVDVTFSQATLNAANGYTVNLRRVLAREIAKCVTANVPGMSMWADDEMLFMRSNTNNNAAASIQSLVPMSGTDATMLGLDTGTSLGRARTRLSTDSAGLLDHGFQAGSAGKFHLILENVRVRDSSTNAQSVVYNVNKHLNSSGSGDYGGQILEGVVGLSKTNGVPPKNFWTQITHVGATGATFTWTFTTAEEDTSYSVFAFPISQTGTPAAGARTLTAITKNVGSAVFTATDPDGGGGAADTVTWHVELRR